MTLSWYGRGPRWNVEHGEPKILPPVPTLAQYKIAYFLRGPHFGTVEKTDHEYAASLEKSKALSTSLLLKKMHFSTFLLDTCSNRRRTLADLF